MGIKAIASHQLLGRIVCHNDIYTWTVNSLNCWTVASSIFTLLIWEGNTFLGRGPSRMAAARPKFLVGRCRALLRETRYLSPDREFLRLLLKFPRQVGILFSFYDSVLFVGSFSVFQNSDPCIFLFHSIFFSLQDVEVNWSGMNFWSCVRSVFLLPSDQWVGIMTWTGTLSANTPLDEPYCRVVYQYSKLLVASTQWTRK